MRTSSEPGGLLVVKKMLDFDVQAFVDLDAAFNLTKRIRGKTVIRIRP